MQGRLHHFIHNKRRYATSWTQTIKNKSSSIKAKEFNTRYVYVTYVETPLQYESKSLAT
jgi:hypothetical protein